MSNTKIGAKEKTRHAVRERPRTRHAAFISVIAMIYFFWPS